MTRPTNYFAMAQYLQSDATRVIEFKDDGFYCDYEEVSGRQFRVNLETLHFASVADAENGPGTVRDIRSLWDCFSDYQIKAATGNVTDGTGEAGTEQALVVKLEDYETGDLFSLVLRGRDGRAAIGRLCSLFGWHAGNGDAVIRLTIRSRRGFSGYPIKVPELSVVMWDHGCRSSDMDDDIPF
jgi:hypothetical protein